MAARRNSRTSWLLFLAAVIATGILSRVTRTGLPLIDKYLGDALYAVMVYAIFRLTARAAVSAACAAVTMTAIECFQLTGIPAQMLASGHRIVRLGAHLLGVQFSVLDLLAYAVGIACIYLADASQA